MRASGLLAGVSSAVVAAIHDFIWGEHCVLVADVGRTRGIACDPQGPCDHTYQAVERRELLEVGWFLCFDDDCQAVQFEFR